ncbi:MAG: hypothetical protein LBG43_01525 [Treponema sp.]|jgi:hypothetical protein|nr:hypothetical protein [Treponema sp.]
MAHSQGKELTITVKSMAVTDVLPAVAIVPGTARLSFIVFPFGASSMILQTPVIIDAILEALFGVFFIGFLFGVFNVIQSVRAHGGDAHRHGYGPLLYCDSPPHSDWYRGTADVRARSRCPRAAFCPYMK